MRGQDLTAAVLALLRRYVQTGSRADAAVAADALREAGYEEAADDVDFSATNCRKGRRILYGRVVMELEGVVFMRGKFPRLRYDLPSRAFVAIEADRGARIVVWQRLDGPDARGRFDCVWTLWGVLDRKDRFDSPSDFRKASRLELTIESLGQGWLPEWLRGLSNHELAEAIRLLDRRFALLEEEGLAPSTRVGAALGAARREAILRRERRR